jgi:hypothetical protein
LLCEFAIKSLLADPRAVEFPHNEAIFFNEIANGLVSALDLLEPLMLFNMPLDDLFLGIQYVLEPFASAEHTTHHLRGNIQAHGTYDWATACMLARLRVQDNGRNLNPPSILASSLKLTGYAVLLITSKASDARRSFDPSTSSGQASSG